MPSLIQAINNAKDRRRVPFYEPGHIASLGLLIGLRYPFKILKDLIPALDRLPPAVITRNSGSMTAGYVHGNAQLGLQSDGMASLRGSFTEDGVVGDNFLVTAILTGVRDERGATLVFAQTGNIAGSLTVGKDHAEFQLDASDPIIADQWDAVKASTVQFSLHVSTDPFQMTEGFLGSFLVLGLVKLVGAMTDGSGSCRWSSDENYEDADMEECTGEGDETGDDG